MEISLFQFRPAAVQLFVLAFITFFSDLVMSHEFRIPRTLPPVAALHAHQFGQVPHDDFDHLQHRLAYEAGSRNDGLIALLIAEHPTLITMGRAGSRADILCDDQGLAEQKMEIEQATRGGGCILHEPGQLSIAIVAPLNRLKWSIGDYLQRLQLGLQQTLLQLGITPRTSPQQLGVWGRSGLLAALGVHVRHGLTSYGAYLNVNPKSKLHARILTQPHDSQPHMGSLLAEKASAGRMYKVRALLPVCLSKALGCEQFSLFTGHTLLPATNYVDKLSA